MSGGSFCSDELNADLFGQLGGFEIEVVEDLHVITEKSEREEDDCFYSRRFELAEMIENVGFEPRVLGTATAALVNQRVAFRGNFQAFTEESCGFGKLMDVIAASSHRLGNAMSGEDEMSIGETVGREFVKRFFQTIRQGGEEAGVIVKDADLIDLQIGETGGGAGMGEVLQILPATGVRTECRGDEGENSADPRLVHFPQGVRQ